MSDALAVPRLAPDEPPDERFVLRDRVQIARLLRRLADEAVAVTAFYGDAQEVLHTAVTSLSRDERAMYLAWHDDADVNERVESAGRLACVGELDGVKLQFELTIDGSYERARSFSAPLPAALLRIQRRDYYRLVTPVGAGVVCLLPAPKPNGARHVVEATVVDISAGGLALLMPPTGSVTVDTVRERCVLRLPDSPYIECTLQVRTLVKTTDGAGRARLRAGCAFVRLPDAHAVVIQRYIRRVEVERRALEEAEQEAAAEAARQQAAAGRRFRRRGR